MKFKKISSVDNSLSVRDFLSIENNARCDLPSAKGNDKRADDVADRMEEILNGGWWLK